MESEWRRVDRLSRALGKRFGPAPKIALVLGSGLGPIAGSLEDRTTGEAKELPGWPASTVEGHAGLVHRGRLAGVELLVVEGRIHLYEGRTAAEVVRSARAVAAWGVETMIFTNAAGGIAADLAPGDLMAIEDQINLTGANPLAGILADKRGPRFPDMSEIYSREIIRLAVACAKSLSIGLKSGVYAGMLGPSYETPAEVRMLAALGASAVGMSTVLEAIAAKQLGARLFGVSCISNRAAGLPGAVLDHREVQEVARKASSDLAAFFSALVPRLGG